jgi:hypothetical protein
MDGIRAWGLRIVAGVLILSGVLALASAASTGQVQIPMRSGRGALHLAGMGAVGISLFILGCGGIALLSSFPRTHQPRGLQTVATSLLIVGGLLAGLQFVLSAVA